MDGYAIYPCTTGWRSQLSASPAGLVNGLPVGMQIVGPPGSDPKILRLAEAFCDTFPLTGKPQIG